MLSGTIKIEDQEQEGNYDYHVVPNVSTISFYEEFGEDTGSIVTKALSLILEEHPKADFMQVFRYQWPDGHETEFWASHEFDHVTFLLPQDYCYTLQHRN